MTENEAVERIRDHMSVHRLKEQRAVYITSALEMAISALEEIQLYKDGKLFLVPEDVYSRQCNELDNYKEIGTVKECREAVEKQKTICASAEKYSDGKCIGYGKSETDDEPCEMCKRCNIYEGYDGLESEGE